VTEVRKAARYRWLKMSSQHPPSAASDWSIPGNASGRGFADVTASLLATVLGVMADPQEFVELYASDARSVLVFFARRTLDGEVALDLTAETFAQAWRGWGRLERRGVEETRAWLFTIARRQLGRYLRRGRVEKRAVRALGIRMPTVTDGDIEQIDEAAALAPLREALGVELASLGVEQREALQLRVVDELPYPVVAQLLGITEATARARVSRGLRALARALDPDAVTKGAAR
jgi:RNA polymerase sigma factor (sigma-70 family)